MNVNELYRLAEWFEERYPQISKLYNELLNPLQHNASQPNKSPVEGSMEALTDYLSAMSFRELSIQQLSLLESLGVDSFIGSAGKQFVNSTIRVSDFDPATAAQKMQEAVSSINSANTHLVSYRDSVNALNVDLMGFDEPDDFITIRVGFRNDAAIENIADWKSSAREWYEIIRGLAVASNEPPESTKIVGAGSGSIILFLAATATVTTLLAIISKNVTGVAKNVIEIQSETENLRQKKILTKVMGQELNRQTKEIKQGALDTVLAEVKGKLPDLTAEAETALANSIKKLLVFNEKGGNVDFVAPTNEVEDNDNEADDNPDFVALTQAREAIQEYQEKRDEVKLLTDASKDDEH